MLYRRTPLPPDIDYFLDGALDSEEISALCYNAVTLLGDIKTVISIVDADQDNPRRGSLRNRQGRALNLDDYAHQLVHELATHEQAAFYASGMLREPLKLLALADWLSSWNHEDQTIGGMAEPILPYRVYHDENYDPTPRVRRRLHSPRAIRRYVKAEDQSVPYARRLAQRMMRLPVGRPEDAQLISDLMDEQRSAYRETLRAARAKFELDLGRRYGIIPASEGLTKAKRKAVTRAASFAVCVIGQEKVTAFTQGNPIMLPGKNVSLEISTRGDIARLGHGGLNVALCTTEGERLSSLCVYFDKTPVLDQIAAFALHLEAGGESEIVDTGNLYAITPLGATHPVIVARVAKMKTEPSRSPRSIDQERKLAAQARYKAATIHHYVDAVAERVWGRKKPQLVPFSERLVAAGEKIEALRAPEAA